MGGKWKSYSHLEEARTLIRQGNFAQALLESQRTLAFFPDTPPGDAALFSMGLLFADDANPDRDYERALASFQKLARDFPRSSLAPEAGIWAGLLAKQLSAERRAADLLERIRLLVRKGDFEQALLESQRVLARFPDSPPGDAALFTMGLLFADDTNPYQDYEKALSAFRQLVEDFPHSPLALEGRVWACLLGSEVSAERKRDAHLARIRSLTRRGNFKEALLEDQRVLARFPDSPPGDAALFSMGLIYVYPANPKKDYKVALNLFTRLKTEFPNSPFKEESQTWIAILERIEQAAQVDIEIEEKTKRLRN
jgi:outer membrane protein assembly factor BamD (BamD/ComL family)